MRRHDQCGNGVESLGHANTAFTLRVYTNLLPSSEKRAICLDKKPRNCEHRCMDTPVSRSPRTISPSSGAWWIFAMAMICLVVIAAAVLSAAILWQVVDVTQPGAELEVIKT